MGAGLPILATLKHLIDTGDKVVKVRPAALTDFTEGFWWPAYERDGVMM